MKKFRKNQIIDSGADYGIEELGGSAFSIGKVIEYVDLERFKALKKAIIDVIPDFNETFLECNVLFFSILLLFFKFKISHSIGGGYLFKSEIMPYPDSASRPLEIA